MEKQRWNPSHREEEEDSEDSDNPEAEIWYYKGEPVAQNSKAWRQSRAHGASSSVDKSKGYRSDMEPLPPNIAEHIHPIRWKPSSPMSGKFMEDNLAILWKIECEFGYLGNVHEYHSSSSGSPWKRLWHEFNICKELSLENNGTAFLRNRKADQWSDRNHWQKPDQFPRFEVGIDKLSAQSSLSIFHCPKSMSSPILYSVWERWETIVLNPGAKFNVIRTIIISANWIELMDNLWKSSERYSKDSFQWESSDSTEDGRITVWTRELHRIIMSMFNDTAWGAKGSWSFLGPGILGTAEKMLNFAGSSHLIFRCTSALEWGKTSIHVSGSTKNIELLLQMVISVNQLSIYGAVADMIEELPVGQKGQLEEQDFLTQPLLAEVQANEERQGNLLQEYEQRFEKLPEDQMLSRLCSGAGLCDALPSPREEGNQSLRRKYTIPRDQEGTRIKGWIQNNVRFCPVSDTKFCNQFGRYSIEVEVQSLFQDQTVSWFRIVNGVDKFVREAMPIQEEGKASVKPVAKATQESNDPYCFQVSKFITRLLRHNQKVYRAADGAVHYDLVIDACKKAIRQCRIWLDEMKKDFVNAPQWSIEKWISVLAKGGGQEKSFQYCLNPNYPHQFLYLRAIQGHSGSTINPALQDTVRLPVFLPSVFITSDTAKNWGQ